MLTPEQRAVLTDFAGFVSLTVHPTAGDKAGDILIALADARLQRNAAIEAAELYRKSTRLETMGQNTHRTTVVCQCCVCGQQVYVPKDEYQQHGTANYQSKNHEADALLAFARAEPTNKENSNV